MNQQFVQNENYHNLNVSFKIYRFSPNILETLETKIQCIILNIIWGSGIPRGGLGCSKPPLRNSKDIGEVLDRIRKKNRRLDFLF